MNRSHSNESESAVTQELRRRIQKVMHGRKTRVEGCISSGAFPDITITATGRSPVIIEAKWMDVPEHLVQEQARKHLRQRVNRQPHPIEAAIALRYPNRLRQADDLDDALKNAKDLKYCAVYPQGKRFPTTGWLTGSVIDLADLIHLVDVPETAFDKAAKNLETSINEAVTMFPPLKKLNEGPVHEIFKRLGLTEDSKVKELNWEERRKAKRIQVGRIAGAIVANALLFQERIAAAYPDQDIPPIHQLFGQPGKTAQRAALAAWRKILEINYWPIFDAAIQIIDVLTAFPAGEVLRILAKAAERIHEDGLLYENDLTGHVFQKLIVDRKYLAAFYTLPTSAALLAKLAVAKMKDLDWSDADKIGQLKIADFACGTGALLSAVYDQIANRYERTGGNPADLHQALMEKVFHGFDVVHYATCLTASILSGKQPSIAYNDTNFGTMPYGRQKKIEKKKEEKIEKKEEEKKKKKTEVKLGSLEFLGPSDQRIMFYTGDPAKAIHGKRIKRRRIVVENNSLDLVIMNPPFTRTANIVKEKEDEQDEKGKRKRKKKPNRAQSNRAAFSAFGASDADQKEMAKRMSDLTKNTCYGFRGGIASAFAAIANQKLKPGGVLALVLPLTAGGGESWQKLRTLLAKHYEDIEVLSLATPKNYDVAFSADTGMADCLVIARKKSAYIPKSVDIPTRFVSLRQRPNKLAAAGETARKLNELSAKKTKRKLESGPFGADEVFCGKEKMGETIQANIQREKPKWNLVRIQDFELVQTAYQLTHSKLHLPRCKSQPLAITELKNVSERGLISLDITGPAPLDDPGKLPRGPFDLSDSLPTPTDTYPTLWNHHCEEERKLLCKPDGKLIARPRMEDKANQVWHQFAGRCHLTVDFGLASQSIAVAFTKEQTIGGRAWPNVNFPKNKDWDYAFSIWMNSTLGLLSWWWHASRQQPGRACISVTASTTLPVLDFRALSEEQIQQARMIFNQFKGKSFRPAYRADVDETREALDRAVLCDWLGFGGSIYEAVRGLAGKWCAEPSVHGGKQRPQNTSLII